MSCKLLLNLVECIRQRSDAENSSQGRELLMRMLEVFVLKFKTITKLQMPVLLNKAKQLPTPTPDTKPSTTEDVKPNITELQDEKETKTKFGFPSLQNQNCNVVDYRSLVKTLVCGVKTITWGCANCKSGENGTVETVSTQGDLSVYKTSQVGSASLGHLHDRSAGSGSVNPAG